MDKIKYILKNPVWLFTILVLGFLFLFVVVIKLMNGTNSTSIAKNMQNQKEIPIQGEVRYTTQETLNTLTGEADNLTQNVSDLKKQFQDVKSNTQEFQQTVQQNLDTEMKKLDEENQALKQSVNSAIDEMKTSANKEQAGTNSGYEVGDGSASIPKVNSDYIWIKDANDTSSQQGSTKNNVDNFDIGTNTKSSDGLLHKDTDQSQNLMDIDSSDEKRDIPMYTIPQNTWLTGVIAEQPLIGIVPVNGEVINPRTLSFAVEANNLAANNWQLPEPLKGIQGDAVCQGFFAIKRPAVTCNVTSLTFIFQDGRIATTNAPKDDQLGIITDLYGNPQISGDLYSNLGYFLAGTMLFSGAQGYGNALSAAQVQTQTGSGLVPNISTLVGNANTYAQGQGLSAAAQAAQQWWVDRMKSTFDYVEVPNWDPKTHQLLQLNVKITREIPLNYNFNARKVMYDNQMGSSSNNSLD